MAPYKSLDHLKRKSSKWIQNSITADECSYLAAGLLYDQNFFGSYPFYKNISYFQADFVLIKMVLYLPNFSLVFLIHVFLYAGVYCSRGKIIGEISKKPVWELIRATSSPLKPREKTRNNLKRYFRYSCTIRNINWCRGYIFRVRGFAAKVFIDDVWVNNWANQLGLSISSSEVWISSSFIWLFNSFFLPKLLLPFLHQ